MNIRYILPLITVILSFCFSTEVEAEEQMQTKDRVRKGLSSLELRSESENFSSALPSTTKRIND